MIEDIFKGINSINWGRDGDTVDAFNNHYTPIILIFMAILVGGSDYVTDRIQCWHPAEFQDNWVSYVNDYCWIKNSYYLRHDDSIEEARVNGQQHVTYYQWIPIILAVCAVMFCVPRIAWKAISSRAGIDVDSMVGTASSFSSNFEAEAHKNTVYHLAMFIDRYLDCQIETTEVGNQLSIQEGDAPPIKPKRPSGSVFNRGSAKYLGFGYLVVKLLYILNIVLQMIWLCNFLNNDFASYGSEIINLFLHGLNWKNPSRFPRQTLCDFQVRVMGNVQSHTLNCLLPINMFNEKIFLFIWWWYTAMLVITIISFFVWVMRIFFGADRLLYITGQLKAGQLIGRGKNGVALDKNSQAYINERAQLKRFVLHYLRPDGVFVFRMLERNVSPITVVEIIGRLWQHYKENEKDELAQKTGYNSPGYLDDNEPPSEQYV